MAPELQMGERIMGIPHGLIDAIEDLDGSSPAEEFVLDAIRAHLVDASVARIGGIDAQPLNQFGRLSLTRKEVANAAEAMIGYWETDSLNAPADVIAHLQETMGLSAECIHFSQMGHAFEWGISVQEAGDSKICGDNLVRIATAFPPELNFQLLPYHDAHSLPAGKRAISLRWFPWKDCWETPTNQSNGPDSSDQPYQ